MISIIIVFVFPYGTSAENITFSTKTPETCITVQLLTTGYTAYDPGETGKGITKTGKKAKYGTCAVDPKIFSFGTVFYVPGYGLAIADDTGGAIKGDHIDLFFNSREKALRWGIKRVRVTILSVGRCDYGNQCQTKN